MVAVLDFIVTDFIVVSIYGTKDVGVWRDIVFRKLPMTNIVGLVAISPIDSYMAYLFRKPKEEITKKTN